MTPRVPPRIATWLLEHLGPGYLNESLVGDLFEEYQRDRTRAWYWRQAFVSIVIGRSISLRRMLRQFAAFRRTSVPRRNTPIRRLLGVFAVTALGAGTLTWACAAPHTPMPMPQGCTLQSDSPQGKPSIVPGCAGLDGQAGGR
ncbi:MAG TPA: hypothetical protein VGO18_11795 [Steroidobacteraceae bacterium]|nr:hypothetical protein [Steroidobacteraceae bacterium]